MMLAIITEPTPGARKVTTDEAIAAVDDALSKIKQRGGKPVSAARGWLPKEERQPKYRKVGVVTLSKSEVAANVRELLNEQLAAVTFREWQRSQSYDWGIGLHFADGLNPADRAALMERLVSPGQIDDEPPSPPTGPQGSKQPKGKGERSRPRKKSK